MNNILELTSIQVKSKKLERISGRLASKVRLTPATALSLRKNIESEDIQKSIQRYNNTYSELRNAIVSAEVAAAEQEARNDASGNIKAQKDEELRNAQIKEDNLIAGITSVEVTKPRLESNKIDVQTLKGKFGTLGKNFGVNVKKGFSPKALSVPNIYSKTYKVILKNADLYKLATKVVAIDPTLTPIQGTDAEVNEKIVTANWKNLFDSVDTSPKEEVVVAMNNHSDQDESNFDVVDSRKITDEEISHRKMIGQLGDELEEVRNLKNSTNGIASPFSNGLDEREDSLLSMLSSLSGVEGIAKRKPTEVKKTNNTEFQDLIEHIVGYKEPVSEEEHQRKEESLQEYYSDPEVSEIIDNLRHKDVLFSFNQPDAYNKIMEAERVDNERIATKSTAIDLLDSSDEASYEDTKDTILAIDALKQAEMLQKKEEEYNELLKSAEEQAKMIQQEDERQKIIFGAEEQAQELQQKNERAELIEGAEEQAKMLKTLYDFIDKQEELEREKEKERQQIVEGAKEQAKMLQHENEMIEIKVGAEEQAQELQKKNEQIELIDSAEKQAKLLNDVPEEVEDMENLAAQIVYQNTTDDDIKVGAEEQAQELQAQIEMEKILNGAKEQARHLQAGNDFIELIDGAKEQAQELQKKNERADLVNGAEEQAQELQKKNERADLVNGAEEQAQELQKKNERADLVNGAEEQAKKLYEIGKNSKSDSKVTDYGKMGFQIIENDDRYGNFVSPSRPIKLRRVQMDNMNSRLTAEALNNTSKKDVLVSLKKQLDSNELDFLNYNESVVGNVKAA